MSRDLISLDIQDLSQFTRALSRQMERPPSHLTLMNMLARAAGYRNIQHVRAQSGPRPAPMTSPVPEAAKELPTPLKRRLTRALSRFDGSGKMTSWPGQTSVQALCIWAVWSGLPPKAVMTEREISAKIDALTLFRDAAQIRRGMVEHRLVSRDRAGQAYHRLAATPGEVEGLMIDEINRRRRLHKDRPAKSAV